MKILIVEDDKALLRNISRMMQSEGHETIECGTGEEGLYYALENACNLAILDRMLPEMDGLTLLKKIRQGGVAMPVLMLTALGAVGDRVDGLDAGADDYLTKPFDMLELLARVRALVRRPAPLAKGEELVFGDIRFYPAALRLTGPNGETTLSKTLAAILELLMGNASSVLSRGAIFNRVWGPDSDAGDNIIDTYLSLLRRRLEGTGSGVKIVANKGAGFSLKACSDSPQAGQDV